MRLPGGKRGKRVQPEKKWGNENNYPHYQAESQEKNIETTDSKGVGVSHEARQQKQGSADKKMGQRKKVNGGL